MLKDRLYTAAAKSQARRSAQTALYRLAYALVRLVAPLLAFTAEEVWTPHGPARTASTWRCFPEPGELTAGMPDEHRKRAANWDRLMEVREDVLKSLEDGAQGEAHRRAARGARAAGGQRRSVSAAASSMPRELPACSSFRRWRWTGGRPDDAAVQVERADGAKCERCWKYTTDVGSDAAVPHHLRGLRRPR